MSIITSFSPVYNSAINKKIYTGIAIKVNGCTYVVCGIRGLNSKRMCMVCNEMADASKVSTIPYLRANIWCTKCMRWLQNINEFYIRPRPMLAELSPMRYINPQSRASVFAREAARVMVYLRKFVPPELARAISWLLIQECMRLNLAEYVNGLSRSK